MEELKPQKTVILSLAGLTAAFPLTSCIDPVFFPLGAPFPGIQRGLTVLPFTFEQQHALRKNNETSVQPFYLYAPSPLIIWAMAAQRENPSLIKGVLCERPYSRLSMYLFKWHLLLARFRMGSDVDAIFIRNRFRKAGLDQMLSFVPLSQWIKWADSALEVPGPILPVSSFLTRK